MNSVLLLLQDQKWLEPVMKNYSFPGALFPPPGAEFFVTAALITCLCVAIITITVYTVHAITRENTISRDEFKDATERIMNRIPFLTVRQGEDVRWLCWAISRDLIRVTKFVQREVFNCYHETRASQDTERIMSMIEILKETGRIQRTAQIIKLSLYCKPLFYFSFEATTRTTARFLSRWTGLLREYRLKHPECEERFTA
jgi:hypothetical protein